MSVVLAVCLAATVGPPAEVRVVGYLPDYRAAGYDLRAARGLTDFVVFSAEPAADGGLDRSRLTAVPWAALRAFKTRERVRLVLCVGGWERSAGLAAVAADPGRRAAFAKSALRVCLGDRLDGIDIDWEHPADAAQQADYGRLLAAVRAAFAPYGLVLSVAAAGWQHLPPEGVAAVNWVNLMAYHHAGVQATFDAARADVTAHTSRGVPAGKLNLGLPFYGRPAARAR